MTTAEELFTLYDNENQELKRKVEELENKIALLEARDNNYGTDTGTLLKAGQEKELYGGEIKEVLVDVLKDARQNVKNGSRRADILDDILKNNPVSGRPKQQARLIKEALKGYQTINASLCRKLRELGLSEPQQGNTHIKFYYYGDKRYVTTMPTSGSDRCCGGQNLAHDIALNFF